MLGRVTKYKVNNDAPSEVFEADSEQERMVRTIWLSMSASIQQLALSCLLFALLSICVCVYTVSFFLILSYT